MWLEGNVYSIEQKTKFRETVNLLIESKFKVFPDIDNYVQAFILFPTSQKSESDLLAWNEIVIRIYSDKKLKKIGSEFVESSLGLFRDFTFFKTESVAWKTDNPNYNFAFDSLPRVEFSSLNLKCYSRGDSTAIYETSGNYFPTLEKFLGNRGKVTWQRAGYDPNKTYAAIGKYSIRIKESSYASLALTIEMIKKKMPLTSRHIKDIHEEEYKLSWEEFIQKPGMLRAAISMLAKRVKIQLASTKNNHIAYTLKHKLKIVHRIPQGDDMALFTKYQVQLDTDLYRAMKALQEYRNNKSKLIEGEVIGEMIA
jgi:hypothetical protein